MATTRIYIADGTEGRGYGGDVCITLTGDVDQDITNAVYTEHPCEEEGCDIAEALDAGYPRVSAKLLHGATETPVLDAVMEFYSITATDLCPYDSAEWLAWVDYYNEQHGDDEE